MRKIQCDVCGKDGAIGYVTIPTGSQWVPSIDVDLCIGCQQAAEQSFLLSSTPKFDTIVAGLKLLVARNKSRPSQPEQAITSVGC